MRYFAPHPSPDYSAAHPPCELSALPSLRSGHRLRCNVGSACSCRLPLGRGFVSALQLIGFWAEGFHFDCAYFECATFDCAHFDCATFDCAQAPHRSGR